MTGPRRAAGAAVRPGYAPPVRLRDPWNVALALTGARILVIPGLMVLLLVPIDGGRWWAAGLYLAAAATDSVDGWLARSPGRCRRGRRW
jgi:phosphatidylglycerophosphate synthase